VIPEGGFSPFCPFRVLVLVLGSLHHGGIDLGDHLGLAGFGVGLFPFMGVANDRDHVTNFAT